jgi:hypothetical protein
MRDSLRFAPSEGAFSFLHHAGAILFFLPHTGFVPIDAQQHWQTHPPDQGARWHGLCIGGLSVQSRWRTPMTFNTLPQNHDRGDGLALTLTYNL